MERILMNIRSRQQAAGDPPEDVEFTTEGELSYEDGVLTLKYDESELVGLPGHTASIIADGKSIVMERQGEYPYRFEFTPGLRYSGSYATPEGNLSLSLLPLKATVMGNEKSGSVGLRCELTTDGEIWTSDYKVDYKSF